MSKISLPTIAVATSLVLLAASWFVVRRFFWDDSAVLGSLGSGLNVGAGVGAVIVAVAFLIGPQLAKRADNLKTGRIDDDTRAGILKILQPFGTGSQQPTLALQPHAGNEDDVRAFCGSLIDVFSAAGWSTGAERGTVPTPASGEFCGLRFISFCEPEDPDRKAAFTHRRDAVLRVMDLLGERCEVFTVPQVSNGFGVGEIIVGRRHHGSGPCTVRSDLADLERAEECDH